MGKDKNPVGRWESGRPPPWPKLSATSPSSPLSSSLPHLSSVSSIDPSKINYRLPSHLPPVAAGTLSFYITMALSTFFQGKILHISTGSVRPLPTLIGAASVAVGGLVAHGTSVAVTSASFCKEADRGWGPLRLGSRAGSQLSTPMAAKFEQSFIPMSTTGGIQSKVRSISSAFSSIFEAVANDPGHALRVVTFTLVAFKLVGGRFWSISPSSYTNVGSFARVQGSLPAKMGYASSAQRETIERAGRKWGCHTCGSRVIFSRSKVKFHADHMPPRSVADRMNSSVWRKVTGVKASQRFYPQCTSCSNVQGGILSKAAGAAQGGMAGARSLASSGGGSAGRSHGLRPRTHHLAGGAVAIATVWGSDEQEIIRNGNRARFCKFQETIVGSGVGRFFLGIADQIGR